MVIGSRGQINSLMKWVGEHFECNVSGVIGYDQGGTSEGFFLKRRFWVDADGWLYEAHVQHAEKLLRESGLEEARGMNKPGSRDVGEGECMGEVLNT